MDCEVLNTNRSGVILRFSGWVRKSDRLFRDVWRGRVYGPGARDGRRVRFVRGTPKTFEEMVRGERDGTLKFTRVFPRDEHEIRRIGRIGETGNEREWRHMRGAA